MARTGLAGNSTRMRPIVELDFETLRRNAVAWRAHAGVPLRAVVKSDGYGWGVARLIAALDDVVDGYFVCDADEFDIARSFTSKPIATLYDVPLDRFADLLSRGGIPAVSSPEALAVVRNWSAAHGERARIRVGLRTAIGWSGIEPTGVPAFARALAEANVDVEWWIHLTDPSLEDEQRRVFERATATLRQERVRIVALDVESSLPLATRTSGTQARLGAGLFGFRFGAQLAVASALRVRAPVVERLPARGQRVGYGMQHAPEHGYLTVVRCGYGDGFPRFRSRQFGLLAVGMQFATYHGDQRAQEATLELIGPDTDLDAFAAAAGIAPHELVVRLGLAHGSGNAAASRVAVPRGSS